MKLQEVNLENTNGKISRVFIHHIGMTEGMEEEDQIYWITEGLLEDRKIGILTEQEYNKARVMFCDIALNYFKRADKPRVRSK